MAARGEREGEYGKMRMKKSESESEFPEHQYLLRDVRRGTRTEQTQEGTRTSRVAF